MRTITFVFSLFTLLLLPAADARADEVADAIAEVKQLAKEYDTGGGAARRLAELAKLDDPRVTKCLLDLTRCRLEVVAIAAYVGLSSRDEPRVLKLLKVRAGDKSLAEEHADVYAALLDALVVRVDPSCLDVLSTVVQRYLSTNAEFSTRAIRAYSRVRQKSVIDQLIKWLGQSESGSGTGTAETLAPEARACRVRARAELLLRLKVATGVERADFDAWRDWWKENERRFEFPELTAEQSGQ